jgi:hypothetical protein
MSAVPNPFVEPTEPLVSQASSHVLKDVYGKRDEPAHPARVFQRETALSWVRFFNSQIGVLHPRLQLSDWIEVLQGIYSVPCIMMDSMRILDIGAGSGDFLLFSAREASSHWSFRSFTCYEPYAPAFDRLEHNLKVMKEVSPSLAAQVKLHKAAVTPHPKARLLTPSQGSLEDSRIDTAEDDASLARVGPETLEDCEFLKVSTCGDEDAVLRAFLKDRKSKPFFIAARFETDDQFDKQRAVLKENSYLCAAVRSERMGRGVHVWFHECMRRMPQPRVQQAIQLGVMVPPMYQLGELEDETLSQVFPPTRLWEEYRAYVQARSFEFYQDPTQKIVKRAIDESAIAPPTAE